MLNFTNKTAATMAAAIVAVIAIGRSTPVFAQDASQGKTDEQLLACDRIADVTEKMACFEGVVKGLKQEDDAPASPSPSQSASAPEPETSAPAAAAAPAATAAAATTVAKEAPVEAAAEAAAAPVDTAAKAAAAPAAVAVTDAAAASAVSRDAAINDFGSEDIQAAEQKAAEWEAAKEMGSEISSIHATIVESWSTVDHRFEVRLDNGQVWRETALTRRSNRLPKEGSPVRITKGSLGSYNMKIGNNNRLAAVRRTK